MVATSCIVVRLSVNNKKSGPSFDDPDHFVLRAEITQLQSRT